MRGGARPGDGASGRSLGETRRRGFVAVVAILLLAFGLRMVRIQCRALWYDEAFAVLYASLDGGSMIYGTVTPVEGAGAADVHPLLYYFSLHGWMGLAGRSPLAVRFLSVILGMITLAVLWRLGAWAFDRRVGLAAGALAALNPFHVAYCQEARMYALLGLAAVVAAWGLLRALAEGRLRWWALYAVAAAVTLYAHNLGAFALLALNLLAVVRCVGWRRWRALLLSNLLATALFAPWLIGVLPGQLGFIERAYWLSSPGASEAVRVLMMPVLTFYEVPPLWVLWVGLFTGLLLLVLLLCRLWRARHRAPARAGWFLFLGGLPVVVLFIVAQWRPVYLERALLPSVLFYLVAVAWLLVRGGLPRVVTFGLATLLVVCTVGSLVGHYTYAHFPRPPFQEAATYLRGSVGETDVVVHTNKLTYLPMRAHDADLPGVFLADPPGSPQDTLAGPTQDALGIHATPTITQAVGSAGRVWLVYFPREVRETEAVAGSHPALAWLESRFVEADRARFNDLVVALYQRGEK